MPHKVDVAKLGQGLARLAVGIALGVGVYQGLKRLRHSEMPRPTYTHCKIQEGHMNVWDGVYTHVTPVTCKEATVRLEQDVTPGVIQ